MGTNKICLTFDVEEFSIPSDYGIRSAYLNNTEFSREGCHNLIDLLKKYNIHSTFFITGYFAEREKEAVRALKEEGHEIASHSYSDSDLSGLSKPELTGSIWKSKKILEKISGEEINGFRTPQFKVNPCLVGVLEELGFRYDSSVHPAIIPGHYWNWRSMLKAYNPDKNDLFSEGSSSVLEIPVSVMPIIRFPLSWWWMRNLGNWLTAAGAKINLSRDRSVILYFHAWEFAGLPKIESMPFHMTRNTGDIFLNKIERFIKMFKKSRFDRIDRIEAMAK